jgi:hypothetical protein
MSTPVNNSETWGYVFNSPLECGLRAALILLAAYPDSCYLQRLVQYDYLLVHSGDIDDGPPSVHPATPQRSGELLVRRSLIEQGLAYMIHKMVIEQTFSGSGIGYQAGEYAPLFLDSLRSSYVLSLRERAGWVVERFQDMPDVDLNKYMQTRWSKWGSEFVQESLFQGEQ